jgi:hypothetical protein
MHPSPIGRRLTGVGAAAILVAGLFAQAAPALATTSAQVARPGASAAQASRLPAMALATRTATATPISRGTVDVRALARQKKALPFKAAAASAALAKVKVVRPTAAALSAKPDVVGAPPPILATSSGQPAASTPVAALGQTEGGSGNAEPADSGIAVGPDGTMEANNLWFLFTDRSGTSVGTVSMPTFFHLLEQSQGDPFDMFDASPRIHFDTLRQRWIATELSWDCDTTYQVPGEGVASYGHGYLDFAISQTPDPQGTWDVALFSATDAFPAQPTFGTSTDKLGLVGTYFSMGPGGSDTDPGCLTNSLLGSVMFVMDWSQLGPGYDPAKVLEAGYEYDGTAGLRIAIQDPVAIPDLRYVTSYDGSQSGGTTGDVVYGWVAGSASKNTLTTASYDLTKAGWVAQFRDPPSPLQIGGGSLTDAIDGAPDNAIQFNSLFAFTSNYPCTPAGDSVQRVCVRVVTLSATPDATVASADGDSLIATNGFDDSFGGLAMSGTSLIHVAYNQSSATTAAGSFEQYELPTDTNGAKWSTPVALKAGGGQYNGSTWGSYLGMASDPIDPNAVWVGDTYAAANGTWATTIHQVKVGGAGAKFTAMPPVRALDTRSGITLSGPFVSGTPRTFPVSGFNGIPPDAVAITGNLTVTGQTAAGFVSLGPVPTSNPSSSTLNFPLGDTRANNVTVALAVDGGLSATYKGAKAGSHTSLVLDVTGYFEPSTGDTYHPVTPSRILDSRHALGVALPFAANVPQSFPVRGVTVGSVTIPPEATAITANLTVAGQTQAGYVSLTPTPTATPGTSTINFPKSDVRANGLTIPIGADGTVSAVYKATGGTANLILDVTGYYSPSGGLLYYPLNPGRRIDTRQALGVAGVGNGLSGIQGTSPRSVLVAGHDAVAADAAAITGNLTVTGQTAAGYISVTDASTTSPSSSTINFPLGDTRANGITAPLGTAADAGELWFIYQPTGGKGSQLILDITGYFK